MADLKDIIAKREELMKAGNTNYTDAMAEARRQVTASQAPTPTAPTPAPIAPQPIQPSPVTPTAPTAQVVPPQPIQPAPAPTQPTDWMGDFSQIKKREPVAPTAVTPEPVAPAPVAPTNPVKTNVKPEAPVVNRQQEIQNNLATGYQTNPALFTDRTAFDQAYNYATKSPEEKATLDSFYNSKQPTISSMYSAILNKQEVPDSTKMTPAYKIAQNRYSKASMYSSMTPTQVSEEMRNAKLVEGSQAFEDLKAINPKLVQDATNLRKVNGDTTNIWTTNPDGTKVNNLEKSIADDYTDNFGEFIKNMYKVYTPAEITAIIRTPDVVAAEDKALSIEKSINEIDKQIANIDSEVDTEFKGSGATGSRLAMEKAARRDNLNKDRDSFVREYTMYANNAKKIIDQNTVLFQTQQQQQQAQNAAMLPFIKDQYKTAQAKKQAEFELNDPATQIKATMDEFAKLGIVAQGSLPQKIAEANAFIAKGGTLGEYINKLRSDFMAKPEYKKIQSLQQGQLSDTEKMNLNQKFDLQKLAQQNNFDMNKLAIQLEASGWTKDANGNLVNPLTGQTFSGSIANNSTYINVPRTGNNVGKDTNNPGNIMGDTEAQRNIALSYGAVGFYKSPNGRTYAVFPDMQSGVNASMADLQKKLSGGSSWANGDTTLGKFASGWVSGPSAPTNQSAVNNYVKLTGYPANTKIKDIPIETISKAIFANEGVDISKSANLSGVIPTVTSTQTNSTFTPTEEAWANNIMNGKAKISDITNKDGIDKGRILQLIDQKTGGTTGTMQTNIQSGLEIVNSLIDHPGFTDVVGVPSILSNPFGYSFPGTYARDFKAELKRMEAIGFLNMIPQMQGMGALSNSEGSRLAAAYSKLSDTGIGETEYKEELTRLKNGMEKALKNMGVTIPEKTKVTQQKSSVGGELDYYKYE